MAGFLTVAWLGADEAASTPVAPSVTLASLLREMADRNALARWPDPAYRQLQASTYNRASVARDQPDQTASGWFADSDGVHYERKETNALTGKVEYVLLDYTGPGALTKFWTPYFYFDLNHRVGPQARVYLDGAPTPILEVNLIEWVTRLEWPEASYGSRPARQNAIQVPAPLAGFTARAGNNYLPILFARGCKVTLDGPPFYVIVSYRAYPPGTSVETFSWAGYQTSSNQSLLVAANGLFRRDPPVEVEKTKLRDMRLSHPAVQVHGRLACSLKRQSSHRVNLRVAGS